VAAVVGGEVEVERCGGGGGDGAAVV